MKYGLIGASGRLGKEVVTLFAEHNHELDNCNHRFN
jgi:dihydrodipicolinate reductase